MTTADKIRIAVAQTEVTTDPRANGPAIRTAMRQAADQGARLIHFSEGALSGYVGPAKPHFAGWHIDWAPVTEELHQTMALAAELRIWTVVGGNHRLSAPHRPHNSLWVINDRGALTERYDKRWLSHSEITGFYTPGDHPCTFEVDGFRFGCLLCIEVNFPELWLEQRALDVDCVLFSTYSEDPIFEVIARAYAATNSFWVSMAVPAQCAPTTSSTLIGPHGYVLQRAQPDAPDLICIDLDRTDPALDVALNKALPWRTKARRGDIYAAHRVTDPRSTNRSTTD
ncbi:carbon-nitrogen hydrolase family protein [Actinoplanes sp. Pm04-4]|uniref:Carbon-nitrogen hydrolase family protein n=1 Tax=Paractinoplanes pyxinae TaxID=2997416 RepID=A0ABT4AS96_9ACTN|nr:carbon-nitrogen hydrolase family protein [Actinoplanes pyxinae]MCY1137114.1 carbon-nitrogen hydrolase family protein [Actinoplanes pyxinae]